VLLFLLSDESLPAFNHNIAKRKRENRPFQMVMDNGSSMKSPQQQQQAANSNGS
jgi:hypothetical protein